MAISTATKTRLEARETKIEAMLVKLYDALDSGILPIASYDFDSGPDGARQRTTYRTLAQLQDAIDRYEHEIDRIVQRLQGTGIIGVTFRR